MSACVPPPAFRAALRTVEGTDLTTRLLIVVTGPVGGGKSTVAAAHRPTAVIDLDLVYLMARQGEDYGEAATWQRCPFCERRA